MTRHVLGLDLGTSSLKAVLLREDGTIAASATQSYAMQAPRPGWAEQNPEHWWEACCTAIQALFRQIGVGGHHVVAVAVGGQMHGTVLLDDAGTLLRPAIIWPDGRATDEAAEAHATLAALDLLPRLGGGVSPGFMLASLLWCRKHEPIIWRRAAQTLLPKDYLRYRLTGVVASEPSDASGVPALDLYTGQWSAEALAALDLPVALMPPLLDSAKPAGMVTEAAAARCGLRPGTPVLCGGSDQAMAAIGAGLLHPGSLLVSLSTGGTLVAPIASPVVRVEQGLRTVCHALPSDAGGNLFTPGDRVLNAPAAESCRPRVMSLPTSGRPAIDGEQAGARSSCFAGGYLAHSATLGAGLSVHWMRETLLHDADGGNDAWFTTQAAQAPAGADGLLFLPYLAGERSPIVDPAASGVLVGLRLEHGRPHVARAALEGIACSLRHALEPLRDAGVETHRVLLAGGLAQSALMRGIVAGMLNTPLLPLASAEQSALGAALLAAVHAGFFASLDEACDAAVRYGEPVEPNRADTAVYDALYAQYRGLYPALRDTMHALRQSSP